MRSRLSKSSLFVFFLPQPKTTFFALFGRRPVVCCKAYEDGAKSISVLAELSRENGHLHGDCFLCEGGCWLHC